MMYSKEAVNSEHLPVFLLPFEVGFAGLFEVKIREVSEERITFLWARDTRNRNPFASTVEQVKETHDGSPCSCP